MPSTLKRIRTNAFLRQQGRCIYCHKQMWLSDLADFAVEHKITVKQARHLQCTAEHLRARKDGGGNTTGNIAAACLLCNLRRHKRKTDLTPEQFGVHVRIRMARGGWHT
jgi:5-methylcytosine-specific restriction endonuclease McrA